MLSTEHLSPGFVRIRVGGDEIDGFDSPGFDDHVKLFFPDPETGALHMPEAGPDGPVWADDQRSAARDYTPRYFDPQAGVLTLDFALHESGPASDWARRARPGDRLGLGGPRGSYLIPADYDWHVLVGDETALPAIARRLEELPPQVRAIVVVEVDGPDDQLPLPSAAQASVHWCHRAGVPAGTSGALQSRLAGLTLPGDGEGYVWVACESREARALRPFLLQKTGLAARQVKTIGYWRRGDAGAHDNIGD